MIPQTKLQFFDCTAESSLRSLYKTIYRNKVGYMDYMIKECENGTCEIMYDMHPSGMEWRSKDFTTLEEAISFCEQDHQSRIDAKIRDLQRW